MGPRMHRELLFRSILNLHHSRAYSPWNDMAGSFGSELIKQSKESIDLYEVSIDTAQAQNREDDSVLRARATRSVDTYRLLIKFARIEISEWEPNKQNTSNHVSSGAVEQIVQDFANSQGAAPQHRHRKRSHVGD